MRWRETLSPQPERAWRGLEARVSKERSGPGRTPAWPGSRGSCNEPISKHPYSRVAFQDSPPLLDVPGALRLCLNYSRAAEACPGRSSTGFFNSTLASLIPEFVQAWETRCLDFVRVLGRTPPSRLEPTWTENVLTGVVMTRPSVIPGQIDSTQVRVKHHEGKPTAL